MNTRPITIGIVAIIITLCGCDRRDSGHEAKSVPATQKPPAHTAPDTSQSGQFNPAELNLIARGNEPFWYVEVEDDTALLKMPEQDDVYYKGSTWKRGTSGWVYEARREGMEGEETLILTITPAQCSDGMSDMEYPLRAVLLRDTTRMEGCAIPKRDLPPPGGEQ